MLISNNRLVHWSREKHRIRFVWPNGEDFCIEFDTSAQSRAFLDCLDQIAESPGTANSLIEQWKSSGISNANEILKTLRSLGILKRDSRGVAVEARSFHAFLEQQNLRDDLAEEDVAYLLQRAHQDTVVVDQTLPAPTAPPDLQRLFCGTHSSYHSASDPISDSEISTLLALAYGRRRTLDVPSGDWDFRGTTGSAGGFYPLRLVLKTRDTLNSAPPFVLRYLRNEHALERVAVDPKSARWTRAITNFLSVHGLYLLISIMIDLKWVAGEVWGIMPTVSRCSKRGRLCRTCASYHRASG